MVDASTIIDILGSLFARIGHFFQQTQVPQQVREVDLQGLLHNPWFLVPAVALLIYLLYKQDFRDLIILALLGGVWYVSGTEYMQTLVVGDKLQLDKVLPLLFGGAAVLGVIIYLIFGRSD